MFYENTDKPEQWLSILCETATSDRSRWSIFPNNHFANLINIVAQIPGVV